MKLFDKKSRNQGDSKSSPPAAAPAPAPAAISATGATSSSPKSKKKRTKRKKKTPAAASATSTSKAVKGQEPATTATTSKEATSSPHQVVVVEQLSVISNSSSSHRGTRGGGSFSLASGVVKQDDALAAAAAAAAAAAPRPSSPISDVSASNQETSSDDDHDYNEDDYENGALSSPRLELSDIQESGDNEDDEDGDHDDDDDGASINNDKPIIKLYKSSRLKAYMTLTFASGISWSSAFSSTNTINVTVVPATSSQQKYAMAVSIVSMCIVGPILTVHFDSFTPLERFWIAAFAPPGSRIELALALFLMLWWSVAVGVQTSISGVAGDGKGQVSLYFSSWVSCWASYWILERWWVAAGYSSFKSFITSWPYRAPGWICIFVAGLFTLGWYLDLWENYGTLAYRKSEANLYLYFSSIGLWQWRLLVSLVVLTIVPAAVFVVAEIARKTKPDGSTGDKLRPEIIAEGVILLILIVAWIPVIMLATTSGGIASQVGNAYFFSWILVVFIAETGVWFVHDLRSDMHASLRRRTEEYHERQAQVLAQTRAIQAQKAKQQKRAQKQARRERANSSGGSSMGASGSGNDNQNYPGNNENDIDDSESQFDADGDNGADDDNGDFSDFDRRECEKKNWENTGSTEFFEAAP